MNPSRGQNLVAACQKQKRPAAESAGSHQQQPAKRVGLSAVEARASAPLRSQQRKPANPQRFGGSTAAGGAYIAHQQEDDPYAFNAGPSDSDLDEEAEEQYARPVQAQGAGRGTGAGGGRALGLRLAGANNPGTQQQKQLGRGSGAGPFVPAAQPRPATAALPRPRQAQLSLVPQPANKSQQQQQQQQARPACLQLPSTAASAAAAGTPAGGVTPGIGSGQSSLTKFYAPVYHGPLPLGLVNQGNTCYLNSVLQVVLRLPCLVADLCSPRLQQLQLKKSVASSLLACYRQLNRPGVTEPIRPYYVKGAMANSCSSRSSCWACLLQQDAHEFFTALLEEVQGEVLLAEVGGTLEEGSSVEPTPEPAAAAAAAGGGGGGAGKGTAAPPSSPANSSGVPATSDGVPHGKQQQGVADAGAVAADLLAAAAAPLPDDAEAPTSAAAGCDEAAAAAPVTAPAVAPAAAAAAAAGPDPGGSSAAAPSSKPCSSGSRAATPAGTHHARGMRLSQTCDPMSRTFWGCLEQELTCSKCGHRTSRKEQFSHLSLQLPPDLGVELTISELLAMYFAEEAAQKDCEACKAPMVEHKSSRRIRRLPRVLAIHLKRFQHPGADLGLAQKLQCPVKPDVLLPLADLCVLGRPLPYLLQPCSFAAAPAPATPGQAAAAVEAAAAAALPGSPELVGATDECGLGGGAAAGGRGVPGASPLPTAAFHGTAAAAEGGSRLGGLKGGGRSAQLRLEEDKENCFAGAAAGGAAAAGRRAGSAPPMQKRGCTPVLASQPLQLQQQQQTGKQQLLGGGLKREPQPLSDTDEEGGTPRKRLCSGEGSGCSQPAQSAPAAASGEGGAPVGGAACLGGTDATDAGAAANSEQAAVDLIRAASAAVQEAAAEVGAAPGGVRAVKKQPRTKASVQAEMRRKRERERELQQQQQQRQGRASSDQDGGICDITLRDPPISLKWSSSTSGSESDGIPAPRPRNFGLVLPFAGSPPSSPNYLPAGSPVFAAAAASPTARQQANSWGVVTTGGAAGQGVGRGRSCSQSPPPRLGSSTNLPALVPGVEEDEDDDLEKALAASLVTAQEDEQRRLSRQDLEEAAAQPLEGQQEHATAAAAEDYGPGGFLLDTVDCQRGAQHGEEKLRHAGGIQQAADIFAAADGNLYGVQHPDAAAGGAAPASTPVSSSGNPGAAVGIGLALSASLAKHAAGGSGSSGEPLLPFTQLAASGAAAAGDAGEDDPVPTWILDGEAYGFPGVKAEIFDDWLDDPSTPPHVTKRSKRRLGSPGLDAIVDTAMEDVGGVVIELSGDEEEEQQLAKAIEASLRDQQLQQAEKLKLQQQEDQHLADACDQQLQPEEGNAEGEPEGAGGSGQAAVSAAESAGEGGPAAGSRGSGDEALTTPTATAAASAAVFGAVAAAAPKPPFTQQRRRRHRQRPHIELWEDSDQEEEGQPQPEPGAGGAQQPGTKAAPSSVMRERSVNTLPPASPAPAAAAGLGEARAPSSSSKPVRAIWTPTTPQQQQQQGRLQSNSASYKLTAIIRHLGYSVNSGHYKADVLCSPEGQWFNFNDERVTATTEETVIRNCREDGYLFFYTNTAAPNASS